jgi:hypothetical protein
VVACGAELLGCVTGLDWFEDDRCEVVLLDFVLSSSPSPAAWEPEVVDPLEPLSVWLAVAVLPV